MCITFTNKKVGRNLEERAYDVFRHQLKVSIKSCLDDQAYVFRTHRTKSIKITCYCRSTQCILHYNS